MPPDMFPAALLQGESGKMSASDENSAIFVRCAWGGMTLVWEHVGRCTLLRLQRTRHSGYWQPASCHVRSSLPLSTRPRAPCSDTPKQIKTKVNKHAFSGGGATAEEQRANGTA